MPIMEHSDLIEIDQDAVLWRYMDTYKFYDIIKNKSLYFHRSDKFSDSEEGTMTELEESSRLMKYHRICKFYGSPFNVDKYYEYAKIDIDFRRRIKIGTVINCWHINTKESNLMWKTYVKTNEGVAIQSNPKRIISAFQNSKEIIYQSKVRYLNYQNEIFYDSEEYPIEIENILTPLIHKQKKYIDESEYRLLHLVGDGDFNQCEAFWADKEIKNGYKIPVDVNELIDCIIFSPMMNKSRINQIMDYTSNHGFCLNSKILR